MHRSTECRPVRRPRSAANSAGRSDLHLAVIELECALVAADEELGHQLQRVGALEAECCRITSQLRTALRTAASSEQARVAAVTRAATSDAEAAALRQRLDILRRRHDLLVSKSAPPPRPVAAAGKARNEGELLSAADYSEPSAGELLGDENDMDPLQSHSRVSQSARTRVDSGALVVTTERAPLEQGSTPLGDALSHEIRLRRLVMRLEQQLSTERSLHAAQLSQLGRGAGPADEGTSIAEENMRLRGELAAAVAERDALASLVSAVLVPDAGAA